MARGQTKQFSSNNVEQKKIVLNLIRIDASRLYKRIKERKNEYLRIYSSERIRSHFVEIFYTRFYEISTCELLQITEETYTSIESYFDTVENLKWYLGHTEDLPGAASLQVEHFIKAIDDSFILLNSFLNAEYSTYEDDL